jgi:AcrR family transcriptional regulator
MFIMAGRPKVREERLDEDAIVTAALEIAQHRVSDLTMRSVSTALQVSVGALYKHVSGRDELISLVVERVLSQAPPMSASSGDGWLALREQVLSVQASVDRFPGLDQAIIAHSPDSPTANRMRSEGIAALRREGLTTGQAVRVYRAVTYLWLGSRAAVQGRQRNKADIETFESALDILLAGLRAEIAQAGATVRKRT